MAVTKVADLVQQLLKCDQDLPVFISMWHDRDPDDYLKVEPLWTGQLAVERVDYDMPHIGGYYGPALVLGPDDDD